jgi:hypothetical protein
MAGVDPVDIGISYRANLDTACDARSNSTATE